MQNKEYLKILNSLNILYIEDEEIIKENIKKTLTLFCENIFDASNIEDAKIILQKYRIDIVITDINLPETNGIEFIKEFRKIDKKIPILILSAYTDKNYLLEAIKLKLTDYLTKPIDFKSLQLALYKCVDEILENSRYVISFKNSIEFNVLHKKLFCKNNNEEMLLTSKELMLLEYLVKHSNRIVSIDELKNYIWKDELESTDSALKNLLNKIRKKIGKDSILNISGVGYRLDY